MLVNPETGCVLAKYYLYTCNAHERNDTDSGAIQIKCIIIIT